MAITLAGGGIGQENPQLTAAQLSYLANLAHSRAQVEAANIAANAAEENAARTAGDIRGTGTLTHWRPTRGWAPPEAGRNEGGPTGAARLSAEAHRYAADRQLEGTKATAQAHVDAYKAAVRRPLEVEQARQLQVAAAKEALNNKLLSAYGERDANGKLVLPQYIQRAILGNMPAHPDQVESHFQTLKPQLDQAKQIDLFNNPATGANARARVLANLQAVGPVPDNIKQMIETGQVTPNNLGSFLKYHNVTAPGKAAPGGAPAGGAPAGGAGKITTPGAPAPSPYNPPNVAGAAEQGEAVGTGLATPGLTGILGPGFGKPLGGAAEVPGPKGGGGWDITKYMPKTLGGPLPLATEPRVGEPQTAPTNFNAGGFWPEASPGGGTPPTPGPIGGAGPPQQPENSLLGYGTPPSPSGLETTQPRQVEPGFEPFNLPQGQGEKVPRAM